MNLSTPQLADRILAYLDEEEGRLHRALDVLTEQRQALVGGSRDDLVQSLHHQESEAQAQVEQQGRRTDLRHALARWLDVPIQDVNLSAVIRRLPAPQAATVALRQRHVRSLAERVQAANHDVAALLYHSLECLEQALAPALGRNAPARYGPAGRLEPANARPLLAARG